MDEEVELSSLTLTGKHLIAERRLLEELGGGGSRQRSREINPQLTPQERRQYEWCMKKYEGADRTKNPKVERERISTMILR